jgi:serine/threonine protein kinase
LGFVFFCWDCRDKKGKLLGKGASGQVFLMEHIKVKQLFAGKRTTPEEGETETQEKEEKIRITIRCVFSICVVDVISDESDRWILMELCEGGDDAKMVGS